MNTKKLLGLNSRDYEHPFDKKALSALSALPGFDTVTNFLLNWAFVKWHLVDLKGSNFHVTKASCPELYNQVKDVAQTLDVIDFPQIYTEWGFFINAYTTGYKEDTLLVLYSGAVDLLTPEELTYIIGHEMGHIKSKHVIYHTLARFFNQIIGNIPLASSLLTPIQIGLMYWSRMSEFSADRAGLLACQDENVALGAIMKMAGVPQKYFESLDRNVFLEQAKEFEGLLTGTESIMKNISVLDNSHPWTVLRAAELIKWIDSGEYERMLSENTARICPECNSPIRKGADSCPICGNNNFNN